MDPDDEMTKGGEFIDMIDELYGDDHDYEEDEEEDEC